MDWNSNGSFTSFGSPSQESFSALLYNLDQFPALETKKAAVEEAHEGVVGGVDQKKKKRLTDEQLRSLERSFEEEVKVDPERKMKLSKELGLQPRQIAVWFQNRRARWKTKQLQHLYHNLKQDFDTLSREKHYLQQEVKKLRSMLREQAVGNQGSSMAYMDMFGEDQTAESTSLMGVPSCNNYMYNNVENFNQISASAPSFWWDAEAAEANHLPSYP